MTRTALSGRTYNNAPEEIDINEWDAMSVEERMKYKGIINDEDRITFERWWDEIYLGFKRIEKEWRISHE